MFFFFFFKQKTAYEIRKGDWSSDVCSSDLYRQRRRSPRPRKLESREGGVAGTIPHQAAPTTETFPCSLRVGRTVISTSCPRWVRNSIRRSIENIPARLRISAETCGCLMPRIAPALAWVRPRSLMILYICSVRRAFSSSCSACGRSRSAKTLPLPWSARILLFFPMLSSACRRTARCRPRGTCSCRAGRRSPSPWRLRSPSAVWPRDRFRPAARCRAPGPYLGEPAPGSCVDPPGLSQSKLLALHHAPLYKYTSSSIERHGPGAPRQGRCPSPKLRDPEHREADSDACRLQKPQNSRRAPSSTTRFGGILKKSVAALALRAMKLNRRLRHRIIGAGPVGRSRALST